jgi:hypothetical protein
MVMHVKTLAVVAAGTLLAANAFAQSTKEVRGASPYAAIEDEPSPKLILEPKPISASQNNACAAGITSACIVWIQYRVENVRIVPVFGSAAVNVSPSIRAPARTHGRSALGLGGGNE